VGHRGQEVTVFLVLSACVHAEAADEDDAKRGSGFRRVIGQADG
jgi:hypothetical protein